MSRFSTWPGRAGTKLPNEGGLPGFDGAVGWLNSEPLTPADLRGNVVLVDFWTYTCINWLRTLAYVRAWSETYEEEGLVVVGVHTPEFPFERDPENVRWAAKEMRVEYPIALDPDYAVWRAFGNHYWPAVYIADAEGRIRHHHFGEGGYEECERVIQELLGTEGRDLVAPTPEGFEVQADWANLASPETYLGSDQVQNFAGLDVPLDSLRLNDWTLAGDWTIERGASVLNDAGGSIAFRFHARDVNLVLGRQTRRTSVPFRVLVDGEMPGNARGLDVDEEGNGTVVHQRLYQLVRQQGPITDTTFEITFLDPGVEAYVFTFG
jgi:thiol-disulfide isomerase/thioredoxin